MYLDALAKMGVGGAHPGGLALTEQLLDSEDINEKTTILDIGCGTGLTSSFLYEEFRCNVVPCDIHPLMIEKANKRFKQDGFPLKAAYGDAEALPFQNNTFDIIISESVTSLTNSKKTIGEYYRVLKPNGKLIGIELSLNGKLSLKEEGHLKSFYGFQELLTIDSWHQLLASHHFSEIQCKPHYLDMTKRETSNDFLPSSYIELEVYDTMIEHEELTKKFQPLLVPCIIQAIK